MDYPRVGKAMQRILDGRWQGHVMWTAFYGTYTVPARATEDLANLDAEQAIRVYAEMNRQNGY